MYYLLLNPSTAALANTSMGQPCVGSSGPTKPMPAEGAMASPWWWSSFDVDVRCGSRSLVVLFPRSKPWKMEFLFPLEQT